MLDAFVIEPNMIEVNELDIKNTGVTMKIGLIADMQRQNADPAFVQRAVNIMNDKNLDVVLIAGDFVHKDLSELPSIGPLKKLKTNYGVYGVLGNHDYSVHFPSHIHPDLELGDDIKQYIEDNDTIRILKNENVIINNIAIIGLDSYWAGLRNVDKAFTNVSNEFKILLAHNQNDLKINSDIADVYLFGHTHCGQIRLPYLGSVPKMVGFQGDYDYKHYIVNGSNVYTTCGLAPAPRFFNLPEIVIINFQE